MKNKSDPGLHHFAMSITWNKFAWASFLYGAMGGDEDYCALLKQRSFLNNLRTNPSVLQITQIQTRIITGFLNRWGCRMVNTQQSARAIITAVQNLQPYLQVINAFKIRTVYFTRVINVNNNPKTVKQIIKHCYMTLRNIGYRFAATATSKFLHILQPHIFVMWDNGILAHYRKINSKVEDSGEGYSVYLQMMQQIAIKIYRDYENAALNPSAKANQDPDIYLSIQMNYRPPKTLAKYIDEYNWVTITNKVRVPPLWHP